MTWHSGIPLSYRDQIVTGDARELARAIPDGSVDLIFTDPPWDDASMPLYEWLAQTAARVLVPGGYVVAYTGNDWLPEIMQSLEQAGLEWHRMLAGIQEESNDKYYRKKLFVKWRPVVCYSKGEAVPHEWMPDGTKADRDKAWHPWGQGTRAIMRWLSALCPEGGVVLEPFVGGGSTLAVCKFTGRHFVGFEIDPESAERARGRIATIDRQHVMETESESEGYMLDTQS